VVLPHLRRGVVAGLGGPAEGAAEGKGGEEVKVVTNYQCVLRRLDGWARERKDAIRSRLELKRRYAPKAYYEGMAAAYSATRLYLRKFCAEAGLTVFDEERDNDELR